MREMSGRKQVIFRMVLLSSALSAVVCDDLFGMRLTTETLKTKENTDYRFHYFVKDDTTGDFKAQEERKEGDSVHGSYTLAEPNGDLRTVTYKAGPGTGFEAKVDIQPNASPMKQSTEPTTASTVTVASAVDTENATTLESTVNHFPGGFIMDILKKPQSNVRAEMGMKLSLNRNFVTEPVTEAVTEVQNKTAESPETTPEVTTFSASPSENLERSKSENSTEDNSTTEDPIKKEIDEAENSMPKLPELVFSDNKTHFKFFKDPEEAFLDERITQIARQLAETSLRREFEERKLGHFIPISVTSVVPVTPSYFSKSVKFSKDDAPNFRPSQQSPLQMLAQLKLIPQYFYKETALPKLLPLHQRVPVVQTSVPFQSNGQWDQQTYEAVTNVSDSPKTNASEPEVEDVRRPNEEGKYSTNSETTERATVSLVPIQIPTLLQVFTPYVASTQANYTETTSGPPLQVYAAHKDLVKTEALLNDNTTVTVPTKISSKQNTTKS